ncbi:MAG: MBL fold metallo-hydrolase [Ruminococcaceae bacterium]|nr:MBL fold metallo-hydrolase [Oscillospiraceae bacterium]
MGVIMQILTLSLGALATNCYIVSVSDNAPAVVIDPGDEADKVLTLLSEHDLTLEAILLTHGHFDHIAALDDLISATGCDFYISKPDSLMIRDGAKNFSISFFGKDIYTTALPKQTVSDGDTLSLAGLDFTVMETPGHSLGSVCYRVDNVLFSGDTLFQGACGRVDGYSASPKEMLRSLSKIRMIDDNLTIYPGHGESTTLDYEKENNMYMKLKHVLND